MNTLFYMQEMLLMRRYTPHTRAGRIVSGIAGLLIGGGILALTLAFFITDRIKCKIPVEAVVLRFDESTAQSKKSKEPVKVYTPVYGYTYSGRQIESRTGSYSAKPAHEIGETVQIRINPDNPTHLIDRVAPDSGMVILWVTTAIVAAIGAVTVFREL